MRRWVDDEAVERRERQILREEGSGDPEADGIGEKLAKYLSGQPQMPKLVGAKRAAEILGIHPPHISRLRDQGRMPEPIEVEGSVDVYFEADVRDLAKELEAERAERDRRREERVRA